MVTIKPAYLNGLLVTLIGFVLVPGAILVASLYLGAANASAGWLRYRLPEAFFWIFLTTGLASPILGVGTFLLLWTLGRRSITVDSSTTEPRLRKALILAAAAALAAPAMWTLLFSEVFFVAGGNR